jgi:hypothetical protein
VDDASGTTGIPIRSQTGYWIRTRLSGYGWQVLEPDAEDVRATCRTTKAPTPGAHTLKRIGPAGGRAKIIRSKAQDSTQKPAEKSTGELG